MLIRVNSIIGTSLKFEEIKTINLDGETLEIILYGGRKSNFIDLKNIAEKDKLRLNQIIQENIANKRR